MKKLLSIFFLLFIFYSNAYAYVDMSKVSSRARDLHMKTKDYSFSMALSGMLSGTMLGLFLWKAK